MGRGDVRLAGLYGRAVNKVLNEHDFPPLMILHNLMRNAKLARHRKGALYLTKAAADRKTKPAELWMLLAQTLLTTIDHSQYTRFEDRVVGNWDIFLNVINIEADNGTSEERLCSILFGRSEDDIRLRDHRLAAAFYIQILRPLCWLGLLIDHRNQVGLNERSMFLKTPLWSAALDLDTNMLLSPQRLY